MYHICEKKAVKLRFASSDSRVTGTARRCLLQPRRLFDARTTRNGDDFYYQISFWTAHNWCDLHWKQQQSLQTVFSDTSIWEASERRFVLTLMSYPPLVYTQQKAQNVNHLPCQAVEKKGFTISSDLPNFASITEKNLKAESISSCQLIPIIYLIVSSLTYLEKFQLKLPEHSCLTSPWLTCNPQPG